MIILDSYYYKNIFKTHENFEKKKMLFFCILLEKKFFFDHYQIRRAFQYANKLDKYDMIELLEEKKYVLRNK